VSLILIPNTPVDTAAARNLLKVVNAPLIAPKASSQGLRDGNSVWAGLRGALQRWMRQIGDIASPVQKK
jgi:hypothetical protein